MALEIKKIQTPSGEIFDIVPDSAVTASKAVADSDGNIITTTYQPKLVSGTNIKSINNISLLGSGNINISGGGGVEIDDDNISDSTTWSSQKINSELQSYIHKSKTPTDIPVVIWDGAALPQSKAEGEFLSSVHVKSSDYDIHCYASLKVQGNSSTAYNKKNFTIKFFQDPSGTIKQKIDFGWGAQSKYVIKANYIDITHARNIIGARLWTDIVYTRPDYNELPERLRTSPCQGAIDGFPIKFYAGGLYWGRYTMNIPKDKWMTNMNDDTSESSDTILCSEDFDGGCYRSMPIIDSEEPNWKDEIHDVGDIPIDMISRWEESVDFVMNSTDEEFIEQIDKYIDLQSAIDYYVWGFMICHLDGFGKNQLILRWDEKTGEEKFYYSAYDMDSTFGLYWDGNKIARATYPRSEFEDYREGRPGNLFFEKLNRCFPYEIYQRFLELTDINGPLSYANVMNRFEEFIKIAPKELVEEDYATTTANGQCVGIPSKDTNNIQQLRSWYYTRLNWAGRQLNPDDVHTIPPTTRDWTNKLFDATLTNKMPIYTGMSLLDNSGDYDRWTLYIHAHLDEPQNYNTVAAFCGDSTDLTLPNIDISAESGILDIVGSYTDGSGIKHSITTQGHEIYVAFMRDGSTLKYSSNGTDWTDLGTIPTSGLDDAKLILGGRLSVNGEIVNGAAGSEFDGLVTAMYWDWDEVGERVDWLADLFDDEFPDIYRYQHSLSVTPYSEIADMEDGDIKEGMFVNINKNAGYVLGYNNGVIGSNGVADIDMLEQNIDKYGSDNNYKFIIRKHVDVELHPVKVTPASEIISPITGYKLYNINVTERQTYTINVSAYDSSDYPITLRLMWEGSARPTVSVNGSTITVNNGDLNNLNAYTTYTMNGDTTIRVTGANKSSVLDILVDDTLQHTDEYYTIESKNGTRWMNTSGIWSTDLIWMSFKNNISVDDGNNVTEGLNITNNPNILSIKPIAGTTALNAGSGPSTINYSVSMTGSLSSWLFYQIDGGANLMMSGNPNSPR